MTCATTSFFSGCQWEIDEKIWNKYIWLVMGILLFFHYYVHSRCACEHTRIEMSDSQSVTHSILTFHMFGHILSKDSLNILHILNICQFGICGILTNMQAFFDFFFLLFAIVSWKLVGWLVYNILTSISDHKKSIIDQKSIINQCFPIF